MLKHTKKAPPRPKSVCCDRPSSSISTVKGFVRIGSTDIASTEHLQDRPVPHVVFPEERLLTFNMLFSGPNNKPNLTLLRQHLLRQGRLTAEAATALINQGREILRKEKNVITVHAPVLVFGDIHGQLYDLVNVMDMIGSPQQTQYLFLGDYVDRGDYSTEVMFYLLAHKICYPTRLHLLRGNHETRLMCEYMTFLIECNNKYGMNIYNKFIDLFDTLPLAAVIEGNVNGRIVCMHGGIGPSINSLADIMKINRFQEPPQSGAFTDLLWADPIADYVEGSPDWANISLLDWFKFRYLDNNLRHTSYFFGYSAINTFLKNNNFISMIRGHQVQDEGYMEHMFHINDRPLPYCFTIFSAPNYCDQYNNSGALLSVTNSPFDIKTFNWKDHPYQLPDFQDGISFSLPYFVEHCVRILQALVIVIKDPNYADEGEKAEDELLQKKIQALFEQSAKVRQQHEMYRSVLQKDYHDNMSRFERALIMDKENESFPTPEMVARRQVNHVGLLKRGASSPALLQRIQRDQSFLQERQTTVHKSLAGQEITSSTPVVPQETQLLRQKTRQFKPRTPK